MDRSGPVNRDRPVKYLLRDGALPENRECPERGFRRREAAPEGGTSQLFRMAEHSKMTHFLRILLIGGALTAFPTVALLAQGGPSIVQTDVVERGEIREELTLTGSVQPKRFSRIPAQVEAVVVECLAEEGDLVEAGQPLAVLRGEPALFSLREAEAMVEIRRATLEELETGSRPEDIASAEADVEDSKARLELAELEEERLGSLLEREAISQSDYDRAAVEVRQARAELMRNQADLDRLVTGPRSEEIDRARAELAAAEANLERMRDDLELHTIRSPYRGVIGTRAIDVGDWVRRGDVAFAMAELDTLRFEAALPERYFHRVRIGDEVHVRVEAAGVGSHTAHITAKVPLADSNSRSFPIRADLPNPEYLLAPGMFGRATFGLRFLGDQPEEGLLVPRDAVVMSPDRTRSVWLVREEEGEKVAQQVSVTIGRSYMNMVEIVDGEVEPGDEIVIRGNEVLQPGQNVTVANGAPGEQASAPAAGGGDS